MSVKDALLDLSSAASPDDQLLRLDQVILEIRQAIAKHQEISESDYDVLTRLLEAGITRMRFVFAERLLRVGATLLPAFSRLLNRTSDPEIRTLAALYLRKFGDRSVIPILLDVLREGNDYFTLVSMALAESGVNEAAPIIYEYITSKVTADQFELLAEAIASLRKLHFDIPDEQRKRWLSDPRCHPIVQKELGMSLKSVPSSMVTFFPRGVAGQ